MKERIDKTSYKTIIIGLFLLVLFSIGLFSTIGTARVSILDTFRIVGSKIPLIKKHISLDHIPSSAQTIIWKIRIPRVLLGVLVGASLSMAGAAFQGMLRNPMADPYVIGISSGAALGASIAIILSLGFIVPGISSISIFAFAGALIAVILVYNIARTRNKVPVTSLLLAGVAVGQFFTAIMSFIMIIHDKAMTKIIYWTLGSLSGKGWDPIVKTSIPLIGSMLIISFFAKDLNIILTGEESAKSLGVDIERTKRYILFLGTLITSIAVSISGIIGFVGLIIPHTTRLLLGPDHRILLPASALLGGVFMVFTDTIARTVISPVEIPVGIITALFGGPFFIYLLRNRRKSI